MKGNIHEASLVFWGQFFDRSFQKNVEKATSDQFPFRLPLIQFSKSIDRKLIELAYSPFSDLAIPAAMNLGIYIMRDGSRLIDGPGVFDENTKIRIIKRIENLELLIDQNPEKNFYIFYHERISFSKYHPLNIILSNPDRGQVFEYFKANKPTDMKLRALMFTSFDDLSENYYKTDHHWNIHGIQKAYNGIYSMLSQDNPGISPALDLTDLYTIPDIEFFGSYARESMYPIQGDKFEVAKIILPPFQIKTNEGVRKINRGDLYQPSNYSKEKYSGYYGTFFGNNQGPLEYSFNNDSSRNLLLIGSSFAFPLRPLLAYHYNHTYYVDPRIDKEFSFSKFITSHPVDDVVVIADNNFITNPIWTINP